MTRAADDFDAIRRGMIEKGLDGDFGQQLRQQQQQAQQIDRSSKQDETDAVGWKNPKQGETYTIIRDGQRALYELYRRIEEESRTGGRDET